MERFSTLDQARKYGLRESARLRKEDGIYFGSILKMDDGSFGVVFGAIPYDAKGWYLETVVAY